MAMSFISRFVKKRSGVHINMEDLTDKILREYLINPVDLSACSDEVKNGQQIHPAAEQFSQALFVKIGYVQTVVDEMMLNLPHFCQTACLLSQEEDISRAAERAQVIIPYAATLREIAERQKADN